MMVNCAPAKCLCLPDLVPAQAFVRAGNGGGIRNWECGGWARLGLRLWRAVALSLRPALQLWRSVALGSRMTSRFWRGCCPRFVRGIAALVGGLHSVHARHCGSGGALSSVCVFGLATLVKRCPRCALGIAGLAERFALGLRTRACNSGEALPSVRARHCGSGEAVCPRFTPGIAALARHCPRFACSGL